MRTLSVATVRQMLLSRHVKRIAPSSVHHEKMRTLPCASILVASGLMVGACSDGSPASPQFKGMAAVAAPSGGDDASSNGEDASANGDAASSDGSASADAAPFANCSTNPTTGSFPAAVAAVLMARCQPCHQSPPLMGAPFPLLTYQDVNASFGAIPIYQEMYVLIQPNGDPHMPYRNAPQLSADQLQTLSSWLLSCAPSAK
jgi:hypothetical protein